MSSRSLLFTSAQTFVAFLVSALATAQAPPRAPDGHPDLQGIWTNSTMTPLERPDALSAKRTLTGQEAAQYEKDVLGNRSRDRRDGPPEVDVGRAYNELFFDQGTRLARFGKEVRTSLIIDPPDGKMPPRTPEAQKRIEARSAYAEQHPADRPEDRSLPERCLFWGVLGPPMLPGPYNNMYQIVQTPEYVMIMVEMIHDVRVIPLDGRAHLPPGVRQWKGDSRGHWEGDTLVVDTKNFTAKTRFRGSDDNLHVTERLRRVDANTILYRFTIDDPTAFTKPWTAEIPFVATAGPIYEYACHEGNYALPDILAGARAEEKKAEEGGKK